MPPAYVSGEAARPVRLIGRNDGLATAESPVTTTSRVVICKPSMWESRSKSPRRASRSACAESVYNTGCLLPTHKTDATPRIGYEESIVTPVTAGTSTGG
jgi:hypothetical protein